MEITVASPAGRSIFLAENIRTLCLVHGHSDSPACIIARCMKAFLIKTRLVVVAALLLLVSAGIVGFAIFLTCLDKEIRARFAGARWALPAQVYAAPLELYPGLGIDATTLKHELERLG